MNETTPFFQSHGFWLCLGLFIGAIIGWFACAICAISSQASRDEERWEEERVKESLLQGLTYKDFLNSVPITRGKPDRE